MNAISDSAPPSTAQRGFDPRVWLLAFGTFAIGTDSFVVSGLLNQLAHDLAIDLAAAGNVVSSYSLTYGLAAPLLAALTGGIRKDRVLQMALAAFAVSNALCAIAPTYPAIIGARILAGLAAALYTPTAYALAASIATPERKASALGAVALGITVSFVAGVPLGIVVGNQFGWHGSFWLVCLLSLIAFAAISQWPPRGLPRAMSNRRLAERLAPLFHPRTLLALLPTLFFTAGIISTYTYLGAMLRAHPFPEETVVFFFFIFGMGGLFGTQLGGRLIDRFGPVPLLVLFLLVGILDTALYRASLAVPATLGGTTFLLHFTLWLLIIGQQRRLIWLSSDHTDVNLALNNSCIYVGVSVGSSIGGSIIASGFALDQVPFGSCALFVAALLIFFASLYVERRRIETANA